MDDAMDCTNARLQISALLDGDLPAPSLNAHLSSCAACSRALARGRALGASLAALPVSRPGPAFDAAILAALAAAPRRSPTPRFVRSAAWASALWTAASFWAASRLIGEAPGPASFTARAGVLLGRACADAHMAAVLAGLFAPSPRAGGEFLAASLLAAVLFFTIALPSRPHTRTIGARS